MGKAWIFAGFQGDLLPITGEYKNNWEIMGGSGIFSTPLYVVVVF